ncbi:MAG: permease [Rhizobacter sp.]|nr:permease [Rhizobacter sp.]
MLSRLQRALTLGLLAVALAWLAWMWESGHPVVAVIGTGVILGSHAVFLAIELAIGWRVNRRDAAPRATVGQLLRAWWAEATTSPRVFYWRQPFRAGLHADTQAPAYPLRHRGVVLVHGLVCNRGLWNPWMPRLQALGVPYVALSLEPVFAPIESYGAQLDEAVRRMETLTGMPPVVVAHSMGGLVVRSWLSGLAREAFPHRVITVGTPHHGTFLAHFSRSPSAFQMRPRSAWLTALARAEPPERWSCFTCFYSHCDNVVFPASTATLPGADNRHVQAAAHVDLIYRPEVFDETVRWTKLDGPAG